MSKRKVFWLVVILTLTGIFINVPNFPLKINLGSVKIDTKISHLKLDFEFLGSSFKRDLEPKLGLDLQGGTHLVLQAEMSQIAEEDRDQALESSREVIDKRVNLYGVSEPIVQTSKVNKDYRLLVELPGVKDVQEAKELIGQTAQLEFRELDPQATQSASPNAEPFITTNVTGKDLKRARPAFDPQSGSPIVEFELNDEGGRKFEELTKRIIGQPLAIYLDGKIVTAPTVQSAIKDKGIITGNFTADETKRLAIQLNAGALPVPIKVIEERTVGATLGEESISSSVFAGALGLLVVAVFMIIFYGWKGLIADIALIIYSLMTISLFKLIPVTLTLAGIAGFILSIGMAVDANILIFERMKEEIRAGRNLKSAVEIGFARAWSSIRDSNISSLITSSILYWFGTGAVRGFALTLALGILVSMFSSIVVTRNFLRVFLKSHEI